MAYKEEEHPRTDETGDIDLDLLEATLKMSYAERIEQNYRARIFVSKLAAAGAKKFGHPDTFNDRSANQPPLPPER